MKYYTPELLARFGSDDLAVAKAAQKELEQKADEYVSHLDRVRPKLPPRFAEVQERFYLHDSRLVEPVFFWAHPESMRDAGRYSSFFLILQLDTPPQEILVMHYRFVLIEQVSHHPAPQEENGAPLEWLHDEIDLVGSDDHTEYGHSILLTHGIELRLRFRDFDYAILKPMGQPSKSKEPPIPVKG
jgi:hypothetical protein